MRQLPEILTKRSVAKSRLFEIEQVDLHFSNGVERTFERILGSSRVVMIVPMLDAETVLLVREYHVGTESYEITCPKGLLEVNEDMMTAANRELQEEIGYGARELQHMTTFAVAPGYMTSAMDVVLARDLYEQSAEGDEPEPLEVVPWKISQLPELLQHNDCREPRTIAALYMAKDLLMT